ncbi:volume-regulated anion channel subunit LRRC8D [Rhinichthys klamathensis goyatoka]|uniref:volume-regulated anion channel subunit LRRC8D n=1 Tax=Rhinichthys klamathensis goyatoka TaxID=3034132 RepID=UPI0024B4A50E|nr:volume-regulated anion channel subunit LRRC8D [Rhinichthys klamathensis goyatoka]
MFTLSELWSGGERQGSYKLLKPWWEVFMDYLLVLMLMVSILAGTLLLSRDGVVCVPVHSFSTNYSSTMEPMSDFVYTGAKQSLGSPAKGRRTNLDFQQYVYISQVCYHEALPWFSRFLPYVTLLHTLVLLASGCFWFHFPLTSARIEHFLSLLAKCCESPWTTRALSHTAKLDTRFSEAEQVMRPKVQVTSSYKMRKSSLDSGTDSPLLAGTDSASTTTQPSPCPSTLSHCSTLSARSLKEPLLPAQVVPDGSRPGATLDRSDREQARALFERVRRFRAHCESSDVIYKVYTAQTVFKVLKFVLIVSYTTPLLSSISFSHVCQLHSHALTGYSLFQCSHSLSSVLRKLMQAYISLLFLFGLLGVYALFWIFHKSLRQYSFQSLREKGSMLDAPDLHNDLAFLLHMADQYDPLLSQRLSVFLSPVSETRLLEESLERRWGAERLRSMITSDTQGRSLLQLVALPRLPPALFTLSQLQVLKLELIGDAKLTAQISNMTALRELHLYHCTASVEPAALQHLQEHLETLHLTFTHASEIPAWVYSLRGLQELHLSGRLSSEGGMGRGWALMSLRQLRHLRVLVLRGALQTIPGELSDLAGSLVKLEIYNEGTRLLVLTGLRRLTGLAEVQLNGCQLERLPSALLALTGLRILDLQHNSLRTLEELLGLQHLRRLSGLRLACNQVLALPATVGVLRSLELLDLAQNQLRNLPSALFTLRRLRRLLLAGNLLEVLPAEVGALTLLSELDLSANRLERLPKELFGSCVELRSLNVANNSLGSLPAGLGGLTQLSRLDVRGNSLEELPVELGSCFGLRGGGFLAENWLMHTLPPQVRDVLQQTGSSEPPSRPNSDCFPNFSTAQWSFHSALESRI